MPSHLKTIKVLGEVDVSHYVDLFSDIDDADWMGDFNKVSQKYIPFFREIDRLPVLYAYKVSPEESVDMTVEDFSKDVSDDIAYRFINSENKNDIVFKGLQYDKYFDQTFFDDVSKLLTDTLGKGQVTMYVFNLMNSDTKIPPHKDVRTEGKKRIHIPIVTHPDILLYNNGDEIHMEVGKVYQIDHNKEHSVVNSTDCERIHLVIDWKIDD